MRIVIATGGSGGHIFPALCVARQLRADHHDVFCLVAGGRILEKIKERGFPLQVLPAKGFSLRSLPLFFQSVLAMVQSLLSSFQFLKKYRPDVVVGFGGYGAFSVVLAAFVLRQPTMIHEQNVVPGRANRVLSKMVDKIAVSFQETRGYFNSKKTVLTGCPCHNHMPAISREEILSRWALSPGKTTLLVLGGSQGSRRLNEEFLRTAQALKGTLDFQVIHIAGKSDYASVKKGYRQVDISCCVFDFLEEIEQVYKVADVAISRAGALSVFELAAFQLPAVLIPYPFAGGHQRENARILAQRQTARIIEENELTADKLKREILSLLEGKKRGDPRKHTPMDFYPPSPKATAQGVADDTENSLADSAPPEKPDGFYFSDAAQRLIEEILLLAQ